MSDAMPDVIYTIQAFDVDLETDCNFWDEKPIAGIINIKYIRHDLAQPTATDEAKAHALEKVKRHIDRTEFLDANDNELMETIYVSLQPDPSKERMRLALERMKGWGLAEGDGSGMQNFERREIYKIITYALSETPAINVGE